MQPTTLARLSLSAILLPFIVGACSSQDSPGDASNTPNSAVSEGADTETGAPAGAAARPMTCQAEDDNPDYLTALGCETDFLSVAAAPSDSSLAGALSSKFLIDRVDDNRLYFQNSNEYAIHYDFASVHLSAVDDLPAIIDQASFNDNYFSGQRRFYLGAVTYYERPEKWVFELAPYDTATPEMLEEVFEILSAAAYFGGELSYHPSGEAAEAIADELPESVPVTWTKDLYDGIDYQPLTLGKSCGRLVFRTAAELTTSFVSFQDIVVLSSVPNDISVTQGIITSEFQTPLSHVNVLSQNRGTPNMGLTGAFENEQLRALEDEWVTLEVDAHDFTVMASDPADSDNCLIQPEPIDITPMNLDVTELTDIETIFDPESDVPLKEQVRAAIPAFGGKASHYSALAYIEEANAPKAFAIPIYYYNQFMTENGFDQRINDLLADEQFQSDPAARDAELAALRADMEAAPINQDFLGDLIAKLDSDYPGVRMRFRSSTNAEDLGDFTGAGLYTSKSGDPNDPERPLEEALREVWASIWFFRAFEERAYRGIDHTKVGMAMLVHRSFPDEEANGVAVTANPFDASGVEPAFYVNVQLGDESVVQPENGFTTDQFLYYHDLPGQPIDYRGHSNLVPDGETVLTTTQIHELGVALKAIHQFFYPAYGADDPSGWYAMDVEFKFDGELGEEPQLFVKQARPYPGR